MFHIPSIQLGGHHRWTSLFVLVAVLAIAVPAGSQTPVDAGSTPSSDEGKSSPDATEGASSSGESGAEEGESDEDDERPDALRVLVDEHGLTEDAVDDVQEVTVLTEATRDRVEDLKEQLQTSISRLSYLDAGATILEEQRDDETLTQPTRDRISGRLAVNRSSVGVHGAIEAALEARRDTLVERIDLLDQHRDALLEHLRLQREQVAETQERVEKAEATERVAREQVAVARQREAEAVDEQVRALIKQRREVLERKAELARNKGVDIQEVTREQSERVEKFTSRRENIDAQISDFRESPSESYSRENVDPLFGDIVQYRRDVREDYLELVERRDNALDELEKAQEDLAEARNDAKEARRRIETLGETDVGEQQALLAEARVELRELERDVIDDRADALHKQVGLAREQIDFYNQSIDRLLPLLSNSRRAEFFAVLSNENWESAWFSVQEVSRRTWNLLEKRSNQAVFLAENWVKTWDRIFDWFLSLLWRLLLIGFVFFLGFDYLQELSGRLTTLVFKRRFFRRRPTLTIKVAEVIRSAARPALLYALIVLVVDFVTVTFPELVFVRWGVDAFFIFWIGMTVVKVLVLPRRYRETVIRSPAPEISEFQHSGLVGTGEHADLLGMELSRARKLVRSIRIILLFWLLQHYVPMAVTELLGHSVITRLVEQAFMWGLAIVVYLVLTTWKDDIARLFARLASDRLPRAVEFVQNNKDKFYGVFVIAVASIYVLVREVAMLTKRYASDTRWSKRLGNFVFRKRIEMQQREDEENPVPAEESTLPPEYLDYFEASPVHEEDYAISRVDVVDQIIGDIRAWTNRKGRGSTALPGEPGIGKTSTLIQVIEAVEHEFDELLVSAATVTDKIQENAQVFAIIAELFSLEHVPESRADVVRVLNDQASRIVVLDDCHHLYMCKIGGFKALDTFLEVVNLTDDRHYWVLSFDRYAWSFVNRVRPREHFFGHIEMLESWSDREIQDLIQRRNAEADMEISFTELVVTHEADRDDFYEVIKTANGYFRLLHEFSKGNPAIALVYWERSVKLGADGTLQVTLFRRPPVTQIGELSDDHLFALTAIAQHRCLDPYEMAEVINTEVGFCDMALNFFEELDIIDIDPRTGRASLTPLYYRQVVSRLSGSNFLWE